MNSNNHNTGSLLSHGMGQTGVLLST